MKINPNPSSETYLFVDTGLYPNSQFPVVVYRKALRALPVIGAMEVQRLFRKNKWANNWKGSIYTFDHYHSTAHEVLGVISGKTLLRLGGEDGREIEIRKGDVVIIPAGVAHRNMRSEGDIKVVGGYPLARHFDMNFGKPGERPQTDANIASLGVPLTDPVFGAGGNVAKIWNSYLHY